MVEPLSYVMSALLNFLHIANNWGKIFKFWVLVFIGDLFFHELFLNDAFVNLLVVKVSLFQPHPLPNSSHSRELSFTKRTVSDELQAQQPAMVHGRVPRYTCWTTPTYRHFSYFLYCQVVSVLKKNKRRRSEPISQDVFTSKKWPRSRWWATYGPDCLV